MYEYDADVIRVIDGDSVWLQVDVGFNMFYKANFRLMGINAPELWGSGGHSAKEYLEHLITEATDNFTKPLRIKTYKPDKYGRWLVDLYGVDWSGDKGTINEQMVTDGYAEVYK